MGMGCQVAAGILKEDDLTLTEKAKNKFIEEVKDIVINGSENLTIPSPFPCGDPIPPNPNMDPQAFNLEVESIFSDFHKNTVKGQYEKIAKSLNLESTFSLLPALADPIALAGSFGIEMPELSFPSGFIPYFTGLLVPKFAIDLLAAGVPDFFPPVLLVPKLLELVKVPSIPSLPLPPDVPFPPPIPGIPSPPIPELPALPPIPGLELPPIPGIPNPLETFLDFVDLQVALVTGIPNLLVEMIAKIPGFLPKLGDIKAILAEICGMVRDSGIFGNIKPTSSVQAAATVVLARKTAECLLNAAFASTIGMAPGSAGCAINQQISGYDVVKKKPAKKGPDTPSERVRRYARSLAGVSAGQNDGEPYISSLYFAEAALAQMNDGTVNLIGEPIDPEAQETKRINVKEITDWSSDYSKFAPVENANGQYQYAKSLSLEQSSCALFARSCYYAGGFNAGFFTSLYPTSTAPAGLKMSFILRNYKWLKDDGTFNVELYDIMQKIFANVNAAQDEDAINSVAINTIGGLEVEIVPDGTGGYRAKPVNNPDLLSQYLKPFNQRPYIGSRELLAIAKRNHPDCPDFPALKPGDLIYVIGKANNDHVSVLEEPRAAGFELIENRKLKEPFITIDGGQVDPDNKADVNLGDYSTIVRFPYENNIIPGWQQALFPVGTRFVDGDKVRQITGYYDPPRDVTVIENGQKVKKQVNFSTQDITEDLKVGKPTGILRVNRNLGGRDAVNGFSLGSEEIILSNGQRMAYNETRRIDYIARAELMLDEKENSQENPEAGIAAAAQDELTAFLWRRRIERNGGDIERVYKCFPTLGAKKYKAEAAKKAEAEAANKK